MNLDPNLCSAGAKALLRETLFCFSSFIFQKEFFGGHRKGLGDNSSPGNLMVLIKKIIMITQVWYDKYLLPLYLKLQIKKLFLKSTLFALGLSLEY